jgi:hypothetical protein
MVSLCLFQAGRNPYVFCPYHIRMWMKTDMRRPSGSTKGCSMVWGKRSVISNHFTELVLDITKMGILSFYCQILCLFPSGCYYTQFKGGRNEIE